MEKSILLLSFLAIILIAISGLLFKKGRKDVAAGSAAFATLFTVLVVALHFSAMISSSGFVIAVVAAGSAAGVTTAIVNNESHRSLSVFFYALMIINIVLCI